jgi:hypothetical protein
MRDDVFDVVSAANNRELEAPTLVDTRLPEAPAFVVLLGVQGRVMEIANQEAQLFVKGRRTDMGASLRASTTRSARTTFMKS